MMLFGDKYPDPVRVVSMGGFSKELCGGTHLGSTQEVGPFEIVSEESVSAGVRRIVALTGEKAKQHAQRTEAALRETAEKLDVGLLEVPAAVKGLAQQVRELKKQLSSGTPSQSKDMPPKAAIVGERRQPSYVDIKAALRDAARTLNVSLFDVPSRVETLRGEIRDLEKQLSEMKQSGDLSADALLQQAQNVHGVAVVIAETRGANPNLMRQLIDQMRKKGGSLAALLATAQGEDKVVLVAGITRDLVDRGLSAGNWVRDVAPVVGGGGGGKADMAQAGGKFPEKLPEALETAHSTIAAMLK
jgi:alanyl-tRNA synthetase